MQKLIDEIQDEAMRLACERVHYRHPRMTWDQIKFEARCILSARADWQERSLEDRDTEARREESEAAHADEANAERCFTKRAMVN